MTVLFSQQFDDIYYSSDSGLNESQHVFVQGSDLISRLERSVQPHRILELGFGTGLNALVTHQALVSNRESLRKSSLERPESLSNASKEDFLSSVHYVGIEKYPLSVDELLMGLAPFKGQLGDGYRIFVDGYTQWAEQGFYDKLSQSASIRSYSVELSPWFTVSMWVGDVLDCLNQLTQPINTWYLDGFAPSKNPDMWTEQVFQRMAEHSAPQAMLATYTAAGSVRRGLTKAGFQVEKIKGFGRKRHMTVGLYLALS